MLTPYSWSNEEPRIVAWKQFTKCELGSRQKEYYLGIASDEYADNSKVREFPEEKASDNMSVAESFFEKGEVAAEIFAEKKLDATAVVCFNDEMALGYCKRITKLGYRVPEDISLVSFDGVYCRRYMDKNLTSLDLQPKKMGSKSVDVLLDLIDGKRIKYTTHISAKFIEGETVRMLNG